MPSFSIFDCVQEGNIHTIINLSKDENFDIHIRDICENNILHMAVRYGHLEIVKWAIGNSIDIDAQCLTGDTALVLSSMYKRFDILNYLLDVGADVYIANDHGNTIMHYAFFYRQDFVIMKLHAIDSKLMFVPNDHDKRPIDFSDTAFLKELGLDSKEEPKELPDIIVRNPREARKESSIRYLVKAGAGCDISPTSLSCMEPIYTSHRARIFRATWLEQDFLVKQLINQNLSSADLLSLREEVKTLRKIYHPNLQFIYAACFCVPTVMIITEYFPTGSLKEILFNEDVFLDISTTISICLQITQGIHYLHNMKKPIVHGNLKLSNILVTDNLRIKLTDYGFHKSVLGKSSLRLKIHDPQYCAPEMLSKHPESILTTSSDVYAFSIVLFEILTRNVAYHGLTAMQIGMKVLYDNLRPIIPKYIPEPIRKIMMRGWDKEPSKRQPISEMQTTLEAYNVQFITDQEREHNTIKSVAEEDVLRSKGKYNSVGGDVGLDKLIKSKLSLASTFSSGGNSRKVKLN